MPITVERLTVAGKDGRPILDRLSCELMDGQITLLVGHNGAGKTTLLDALAGLAEFSGRVAIGTEPLRQEGKGAVNRKAADRVGFVFQSPELQLFAGTVRKEFEYSLRYQKLGKRVAEQRIRNALAEAALSPQLLDESPFRLSGGEKRRVALATTIATVPEWLLLDEPTAGLDPDACARLIGTLRGWQRKQHGGVVIATHDLDMLLPVADRIILLRSGQLLADVSAAELAARPELWERAGLPKPFSVRLAEGLASRGVEVPAAFMTPKEAAALAADRQRGRSAANGQGIESAAKHERYHEQEHEQGNESSPEPSPESGAAAARIPAFVRALDPRAKWSFYMCFSVGVLAQRDWPGLAHAALWTIAIMALAGVTPRRASPLLRPFLLFAVLSAAISGLSLGAERNGVDLPGLAAAFSMAPALLTLLELLKIACVMGGGIALSITTTPFAMKRGIEQMLAVFRWTRLPAEALSLAGSLMLRFIPVLASEAARFRRIAQARGKRARRSGEIRFRELPAMLVPLLLSLLQTASDLTLAMASRGYTRTGLHRTSSVRLRMTRRDWLITAAGFLLLLVLWI